MNNQDIRAMMKTEHIFLWQVAKKLKMHESVLCKWFREPLTKEQETQILSAIEDIKLTRIKEQKNQ